MEEVIAFGGIFGNRVRRCRWVGAENLLANSRKIRFDQIWAYGPENGVQGPRSGRFALTPGPLPLVFETLVGSRVCPAHCEARRHGFGRICFCFVQGPKHSDAKILGGCRELAKQQSKNQI